MGCSLIKNNNGIIKFLKKPKQQSIFLINIGWIKSLQECKAVGANFLLQKLQLFAQCVQHSFLQTHRREKRQWQVLGDPRAAVHVSRVL